MNIVKVDNLSCGYGKQKIIDDLSFEVNQGDILGVIGPNGAGKTTLFKALTGVIKPYNGKVSIASESVCKSNIQKISQKLSVVTQFIEAQNLTVKEYVLMGRFPYHKRMQFFDSKKDLAIANKFMRLTGTYDIKEKYLSELSGGERQRVQLAKALTQEPEILLLDEPTSHLDITHQVKVLDLVKSLSQKLNFTVIIIIHDLNLAAEYCNKLLMLKKGTMFKLGTPKDVLTYENIEQVYETLVLVEKNPLSGKPFVIPVTAEDKLKTKL